MKRREPVFAQLKEHTMSIRAFILHSGGIDSSTALARAVRELGKENVLSVGVNYGQRHIREQDFADDFADHYGVERIIVNMSQPPKSMLTDEQAQIPDSSYADLPHGISPTYVPFRNGSLLSRIAGIAQGWIMGEDARHKAKDADYVGSNEDASAQIWFGAHAEDAANWAYPDCTPEFVGAMAAAIYIGTYHRVRLITPFIHNSKAEIIEYGFDADVPYEKTWSCYAGGLVHCGTCPTCRARKEAFRAAVIPDPTEYANAQKAA
jgi:7-cyano-7-deazaguanine synthase